MEINKLKIFSLPFIFYLVRENNEESEEKFNLNNIETVTMECRDGQYCVLGASLGAN